MKNNDKLFVVIYARVSTRKQASQGDSLDGQISAMRRYCKDKWWIILEEFKEQFTWMTEKRPEIARVYDYIVQKKREWVQISYFVIHKMDRGSRWWADVHTSIRNHLKSLGTRMTDMEWIMQDERIVVEVEGMNVSKYDWATNNPSEMAEQLTATSKKNERDSILQRTIPQEMRLSLEWYRVRNSLFGLKNKKVAVDGKRRVIQVPHEVEGKWVEMIFILRSQGWKDADIVNEVNKMWYRSREQTRWNKSHTEAVGIKGGQILNEKQLQSYIKNTTYAWVTTVNWRGNEPKIVLQKYPWLVSVDLWNVANRGKKKIIIEKDGTVRIFGKNNTDKASEWEGLIENPPIKRRNRDNPLFPFGKLVLADNVNMSYFSGNAPKWRNGTKYEYYSARVWKRCINYPKNEFENTIIDFFKELNAEEPFLNLYMEMLSCLWKDKQDSFKDGQSIKKDRIWFLLQQKISLLKEVSFYIDFPVILKEKNKELESLMLEIEKTKIDLEKDIQTVSISNIQKYGKTLIENLWEIALNTKENHILQLLFRVVCSRVPTYEEIINRNTPLRPLFSLISQTKNPPEEILGENTWWQPQLESNRPRRIWSPEF